VRGSVYWHAEWTNLARPFFHKKDKLKQKWIASCERVRRNLEKYTKG